MTFAEQIQKRIDDINRDVMSLESEELAAKAMAKSEGTEDNKSYIFRLQIIALSHKRSGLEEALGIITQSQ